MAPSTKHLTDVLTFGVEEEFVLVDGREAVTVPAAAAVLAGAADHLGDRVQPEFYQTQIETSTDPCSTAAELRADLVEARHVVADAADAAGVRLVASATGLLSPSPLPITQMSRYLDMAWAFPEVVARARTECSGCHVHLGPLGRDEAVALGTHLRPWLPLFQALAANSPFGAGRDRGCASWRYFEFQLWPTVGPAPRLDSGAGYEAAARGLMESGTILDRKMIYWWARPSERWPTLEIRVADVNSDLDVPVLLAVLARGLAATTLARLRADKPIPACREHTLLASHRAAAEIGPAAEIADPLSGTTTAAGLQLADLLDFVGPALKASGDWDTAHELLATVLAYGGGAVQQHVDFQTRGSLVDTVDGLVQRTAG